MSLTILGLSGALTHDPSAALYIDGRLVAAAEEERFVRDKHAKNRMPYEAAKFCLAFAGIRPRDVDVVAIPFAPIAITEKARWHYAKRYWYAPDRGLDAIVLGNRRFHRYKKRIEWCLAQLGFDLRKVRIEAVEHHLAHASSAYHCSGFTEKTAIMGIDGKGEYATTFFGYGENGRIHKIKEFYDPDSLGGLYGAITEYLGFEMLDGEYKVMGMAPYGDPSRYDFSRLAKFEHGELVINTDYANVIGLRRYKEQGKGYYFSPKLIDWLGPMRHGDIADDPYIHYAASMQKLFEDLALQMMDYYLGDILRETGRLAFAGGGALNVKLNQKIIARPEVKELFVQPASGDSGTAVGAASYVSVQRGVAVEKMEHVYLGPRYTNEDVIAACTRHPARPQWQRLEDGDAAVPRRIAKILADGHPVAWFQGRMEFGPRALGGRSILGCPSAPGVADRINEQIKFRERWRPFCPSMLDTVGPQMLQTDHPAPFMTFTFEVAEEWKTRVPEVVHEDGTSRAQVLRREFNPRYYDLMKELETLTGNGVVLNTSLNRRGEPMICSPTDALDMFFGSDLQYLVMEDVLVTKDDVG
ncbi:carbamoyltransferase [Thauera chlorobenzoica]|uniref:Carbamoyltransferase in large core OS assembly cluster n=1 Tax=Thauera chlorobenzoica TaxID=96773 RepID=A0A1H5SX11_9RHOO|nr:carbamoyltransferase [Thauera chlorobenzoica]APR04064.1 Carbamoyltransferase in large core OS assembly cluster [Thauera chlorobenzoica]SEF55090.1 carbamoyltransferase [Thauera chlorobenzoica]